MPVNQRIGGVGVRRGLHSIRAVHYRAYRSLGRDRNEQSREMLAVTRVGIRSAQGAASLQATVG